MEDSKMSIFKWYMAMAFMTDLKKGVSAKELQRQLGHKRYYSIWCLMHKIKKAMGPAPQGVPALRMCVVGYSPHITPLAKMITKYL
jgi:hypothetical protein